jgi:hypothetical protein
MTLGRPIVVGAALDAEMGEGRGRVLRARNFDHIYHRHVVKQFRWGVSPLPQPVLITAVSIDFPNFAVPPDFMFLRRCISCFQLAVSGMSAADCRKLSCLRALQVRVFAVWQLPGRRTF